MAPRLEHVEGLASFEQDGLLRLVYDQLRPRAQLAVGVFPREHIWVAVVFDDGDDGHGLFSSSVLISRVASYMKPVATYYHICLSYEYRRKKTGSGSDGTCLP